MRFKVMKMFFSSLGVGPYKNIFKKKNFYNITSHVGWVHRIRSRHYILKKKIFYNITSHDGWDDSIRSR